MTEENIPRINEDFFDRMFSENPRDRRRGLFGSNCKVILVEGPDKKGYIRFDHEDSNSHSEIFDGFIDELTTAGEKIEDYQIRGGGKSMIEGDYDPKTFHGEPVILRFYDYSVTYRRMNEALLRKTLDECLSDKFSYEISDE